MKKIYLRKVIGPDRHSRIIDIDNLSFVFNTASGKLYATHTADAKTSNAIIIEHPLYKKMDECERAYFEMDAMDHFAKALDRLISSENNMMTIECSYAESAYCKYTFKIGEWVDIFEINPPNGMDFDNE